MAARHGPPSGRLNPETPSADDQVMSAAKNLYIPERRRVVIRGQVQGVAFQIWLRTVAHSLALGGSCRLLEDGTCEAIVQGPRDLVKQFVVACKRGPAEASIDGIEQELLPIDGRLGSFHIERS